MINPPFFEAVFFDMDGTLVDSEPTWLQSESELMATYNYLWTEQDQAHCLGGPLLRVGEYMNDLAGQPENPQYFVDLLINRMVAKMSKGACLMQGALEIINLTRSLGSKTAMVSASPRSLVDAVLNSIAPVAFELTISSDDVLKPKPDPESYLKAARFFGVDPKKCLVLEDSKIGVDAAVASGACVIAIPHLVPITASRQVKVFTSLTGLNRQTLLTIYQDWIN